MVDDDASAPDGKIVIYATIRNEPAAAPSNRSDAPAILPLIVELLKGLAWPLLALTFFLMFNAPIRRTIALIPDKLERAEKGNIGSLSWEILQRAQEEGGGDLARRVGTLSPAAVEELIQAPRNGIMGFVSSVSGRPNAYTIPSEARLSAFKELEAAQLLRFREPLGAWLKYVESLPLEEDSSFKLTYGRTVIAKTPLTPEQHRKVDEQSYELTPRGKQAVEAIVKAIGDQLKSG